MNCRDSRALWRRAFEASSPDRADSDWEWHLNTFTERFV
jgi:hypothetical protein